MVSKHGITAPSSYLYVPAPKKPKKKRAKRSTEDGAAGMRSMPLDDSCAYHLASIAIYATSHPDQTDLYLWPSDADSARATVIAKYFDMRGRVQAFLDDASLSDQSEQLAHWESMMGEGSAEEFVEAAVDTTKWGGSVEMAIAMDHTSTCIIIVHADQISAQASKVDVEGAFQPALLDGLIESVPKTHNMFAILRKGHYYLGYVRTEGVDRALFEVGDKTEFAKVMLIKHLKSVNGVQRKRKKGHVELSSCLSDEDEPKAKASVRAAEQLSESAARRKQKQREEKDCSNSSFDESKEYDEHQMLIYEEEPNVLLVGSVIEVQVFEGSADEFLLVHRYGYAAHNKAAWTLDYTKSFKPAYHDQKDDLFDFTSKPRSMYTKVDHLIPTGNVKAKFELTSKSMVPSTALHAKSTSVLSTSVQAGNICDYERKRLRQIADNEQMLVSLNLPDLLNEINSATNSATAKKTSKELNSATAQGNTKKRKTERQGARRRSARLGGLADSGQEVDDDSRNGADEGELPSHHDARTENDGSDEDEEEEEEEEEEDEEDEEDDDEETHTLYTNSPNGISHL